jgi:Sec-independent protein translocase protein TatA
MNPKTIITGVTKAVNAVRSAIKNMRQNKDTAKQELKQQEQPTGTAKREQQDNKADMERARTQAKELKNDLQKQGLGQKGQEVTGHDGSIPQGGTGTGNSNGSTDGYHPSRGREIGADRRSKGREL